MELVIDRVASVLATTLTAPVPMYPTVEEFVAMKSALFQELGWAILHEGQALSLHRTFKNGKLIQSPDVALQFEAVIHDLVFDG